MQVFDEVLDEHLAGEPELEDLVRARINARRRSQPQPSLAILIDAVDLGALVVAARADVIPPTVTESGQAAAPAGPDRSVPVFEQRRDRTGKQPVRVRRSW